MTFLESNPDCVRVPITKEKATALHVAVIAKHTTFVEELLKLMTPMDLELRAINGFTALHSAAQSRIVEIDKQLVEINDKPLLIPDYSGDIPLNVAAYVGHTNMVSYLFSLTPLEQLTADKHIKLLECTSYNDMYDAALKILEMYPAIASADIEFGWRALEMLASKPLAIGSERFKGICIKALMKTVAHQLVEVLWKNVAILDKQSSSYLVHSHITLLFEATKVGNLEFLNIITCSYLDLLWQLDEDNMSLFHIAIKYRQESVVNLIYETDTITYSLTSLITLKNRDNILYLAENLAPLDRVNIVLGGFRMQRELLWFKEIETIVPPSYMNMKNKDGLTPKELFKKKHKDLQIEAEMWMESTSNNFMVVARLIVAVVFAAVFSVPGSNNQEQGTPILLRNTWFKVFFISDAIALFSSSASILLFLSMFVSRYREEDFLVLVPSKLLLALATLFISIMGMMVAFSAACILMYSRGTSWAPVVLSALAVIPITSFSLVNCKELFVDLMVSSYKSRFLFLQPSKRSRLFSQKMPNREWINRKYEIQAKRNERENVGGSRNVEERSQRKEIELTPSTPFG
ncbi:ankyrin repeat-containing protein NPR4-like [Corylus avellana]|uniref:ankyrin repeat-containing protein NPR4-like n=1 Tax=Corylus avellana TaxID=13451 RepID=UPI00286B40F9|nr:ankyrin repeat-containing protein NPR4-like [Corylus avellana]